MQRLIVEIVLQKPSKSPAQANANNDRVEVTTRKPYPVVAQWVTTQIIQPGLNSLSYNSMG